MYDDVNEILESWDFGRVGIERLEPGLCAYIAGYVAKKMNKPDDPRLNGREPEFRMCSRRPALGFNLLYELLERMSTDEQFKEVMFSHVFPPYSIKIGGRNILLPRYVRDKLRPLYGDVYELQEIYNLDSNSFLTIQLYNSLLVVKDGDYKAQKKERDFEIFKAIKKNVQRMLVEEGYKNFDYKFFWQDKLNELRNEKNDHLKKVKQIKQRLKL